MLDFYAQADDGAVWYFGEDVFNYEDGVVVDRDGSWLACQDGPAAMFMPADPMVGDVYRTENAYPLVFEETTIKLLGQTVDGPAGPVDGVVIAEENHTLEGIVEDKVYAPGYGEFSTDVGGDLEAMAVAVPTDGLAGPPPAELTAVSTGATDVFEAAQAGDWGTASTARDGLAAAWTTYRAGQVPPLIEAQMVAAVGALDAAVDAQDRAFASQAAIDVRQSGLDLELRYRPPVEIDLARMDLWATQILLDASTSVAPGVVSDVVILEWIWPRASGAVVAADASRIEDRLAQLRSAADREDLAAAAVAAAGLRDILREVTALASLRMTMD